VKLRFDEENHAYFLDGKRAKGVTSSAKYPEDTYNLEQWEKRMVAIGLATDPDLLQAVAAHTDENDKDKKILNGLCDQAKDVAKANRGARRGTAAHRITEAHDAGEPVIPTELGLSVVAGWSAIFDACGFEIIPDYMERIVVYPQLKLCGMFDRIVRTRKGKLVILDLKSGENAINYPRPMAVQLALYANAPLLAGKLDRNGETTEFEPMPEVDKKWGVIIHLPETGPVQAVRIDIEKGWQAAQEIVFPTYKWRKVYPEQLLKPLAVIEPPPAWQPPNEGAELTEFEINGLRNDFKKSPGKANVDRWIKESVDAGRSFNIAGPGCTPTQRRMEIIRAAIAWADQPDDIVMAALVEATAWPSPDLPIGYVLGSLNLAEAQSLQILADDLYEGRIALTFAEDGTPVLSDAQPLPAA
jgi:hypothetical protein